MIAIFSLDGTLALNEHRQHFLEENPKNWKAFNAACGYDKPNKLIIELFHDLRLSAQNIVAILSDRSEEIEITTQEWIDKHIFNNNNGVRTGYYGLWMREEVDYRDDRKVKSEMFESLLLDIQEDLKSKITLDDFIIFDDRQKVVDMWRKMGLVCCQVAPGNF